MSDTGDQDPTMTVSPPDQGRIDQIRLKVRGLRHHTMVYVGVNVVLFLIDMFTPGGPWFWWPLLGWGIGLAAHWISVTQPEFVGRIGKDWEDRMVERLSSRDDGDTR